MVWCLMHIRLSLAMNYINLMVPKRALSFLNYLEWAVTLIPMLFLLKNDESYFIADDAVNTAFYTKQTELLPACKGNYILTEVFIEICQF